MQEDLKNTGALLMPMKTEHGLQQPAFSCEGAYLSLQLASLAYTLDTAPWRENGWRDMSYHIDNSLWTGEEVNGGGMLGEYRQLLARFKAKTTNWLGQVMGTVRNREESDTCKAVVMCRKDGSGKYVVAIGFMGTGKRFYDWISNFRIAEQEGMHQGCLQLTRHFEESLSHILFPETAKELSLNKLTLQDILTECRQSGSRFKIWLAGHSQGGAVMQLFAYRAIANGVLRSNLIGYGFASPSVMYKTGNVDLRSIPLFHLLNADDLTTRVGARLHIGRCLNDTPMEEMRKTCYGKANEDASFREMMLLIRCVRNNLDAMLFLIALLNRLQKLSDSVMVAAVSEILGRFMPEKLLGMLGGRMEDMLSMARRFVERNYYRSTGSRYLPQGIVAVWEGRIGRMMETMGARQFVKYLLQVLGIPHRMRMKESYGDALPAYAYMVERDMQHLKTVIMPCYLMSDGRQRLDLRMNRRHPFGRLGRGRRRSFAEKKRKKAKED